MTDQSVPVEKPQLVVRIIATKDGARLGNLAAEEAAAMGLQVDKPIRYTSRRKRPVYADDAPRADFAVVILTPRYMRAVLMRDRWTRIPGFRDLLCVWDMVTPYDVRGPWTNHQTYVFLRGDAADDTVELREAIERLVRICDRCGALCRHGSIRYFNPDTGERTQSLCGTCVRDDRVNEYRANKILDTYLLLDVLLDEHASEKRLPPDMHSQVSADNDRIYSAIKRFETNCWFGSGIQAYYQKSRFRGHELAGVEGFSVLMWGSAGRVLITLADDETGENITLICAEDSAESTMGWQSVYATADTAIRLIESAISAIESGRKFEVNKEVTTPAVAIMRAQQAAES